MNATATITTAPGITHESGLFINRRLHRCVDPGRRERRNDCSLFTFKRVSDELYTFVRTGVSVREAQAWLQGADEQTLACERQRRAQHKLARDLDAIIAQAQADGRDEAARFIRAAWRERGRA